MIHRGLAWVVLVGAAMLARAETVVLDGSSGMLPLARSLASAFQQRHADPRIEVGQGLGTAARLRALDEGKVHVVLASHGVKPDELRERNLRMIEVAKGAVVFAVNSSVPLAHIGASQVCDIYSGRMSRWSSAGGGDHAVVAFTRPASEVDPEVIRSKLACFKDLKEPDTVKVMARGPDMAKALAETPHAIGMTSMTVVEQSSGRVKALALDGMAPTAENVKSGRYALARDFMFVVKADPPAGVRRFLEFVLGPDGDRVLRENGAVPLR